MRVIRVDLHGLKTESKWLLLSYFRTTSTTFVSVSGLFDVVLITKMTPLEEDTKPNKTRSKTNLAYSTQNNNTFMSTHLYVINIDQGVDTARDLSWQPLWPVKVNKGITNGRYTPEDILSEYNQTTDTLWGKHINRNFRRYHIYGNVKHLYNEFYFYRER